MNRRDFLKKAGLGMLTLVTASKAGFIPEIDGKVWDSNSIDEDNSFSSGSNYKHLAVRENTKNKVYRTISRPNKNNQRYIVETNRENIDYKYNRSIKLIGREEVYIFKKAFGIEDIASFVQKVKEIQQRYGLKEDGIIGLTTLSVIYSNYLIPNKNSFSGNMKLHIEGRKKDFAWINRIKREMRRYPDMISNNGVKPKPWGLLSRINHKIYGDGLSLNKAGTFISKDLVGKIPNFLNINKNIIYIENFNGRKIMRVYVNGVLQIATYVSPGKSTTKTPRGIYKTKGIVDKYHASSNEEYRGAVMPYAVHVVGGIWLHGSSDLVDGKGRSHGCIRVPLFYQKKLYELVKNGTRFQVNTTHIYSSKNNFVNVNRGEDLY